MKLNNLKPALALIAIICSIFFSNVISFGQSNKVKRNVNHTLKAQVSDSSMINNLLSKKKKNPLLPILIHSMERCLKGEKNLSEIDKIIQDALGKHTRINKQKLQEKINSWKTIPLKKKARFITKELQNLKLSNRIGIEQIRQYLNFNKPQSKFILSKPKPLIKKLEPNLDGGTSFFPNLDISIIGALFSPDVSKNKIKVIRNNGGKEILVKTINPITAARDKLTAKWPEGMDPGAYLIQVEVENLGKSNKKSVWSVSPPLTGRPILNEIDPNRSYPGKTVYINGENLRNLHLTWTVDARENNLPHDISYSSYAEVDPDFGSRNQLKMTIPQNILPGRYMLYTMEYNPQTRERDPGRSFTVIAPEYSIDIERIRVSPPPSDDHVFYLFWVIMGDSYAWTAEWSKMRMSNPIYRTEHGQPFHIWNDVNVPGGNLFPMEGDSKKIRTYLFTSAQMFYQYLPPELRNNPEESTEAQLDFYGDVAQGVLSLLGPEGAAAGEIAGLVFEGLCFLLCSEEREPVPGPVREWLDLDFTYDSNDLQMKTKAENSFTEKIRKDDRVSQKTAEIYYKITRHQPEDM